MNIKIKNLILTLLVIGTIVTLLSTTQVSAYSYGAKKPVWTQIDYTNDGIPDCQYHVTEHEVEARDVYFITVVYKDVACNYLGEEVWVDGQGIIKDTFEPWTYPFPS